MLKIRLKLIAIVIVLFFGAQFALAGDIGNCSGHAWSELLGWVSLSGAGAGVDYGVTVGEAALSGYAWSEKTGWINFDDSGSYYSVTKDANGKLSGYAWTEKLGYISFDDGSANNYYQVEITAGSGGAAQSGQIILRTGTKLKNNVSLKPGTTASGDSVFSGYAWTEKGGYINFNDAGSLYGAETSWN